MRIWTPAMCALALCTLEGCTDLTPIQNDLKDLRSQVSRLSAEQASMKASLDAATRSVKSTADTAAAAATKAEQALNLGRGNQESIDVTNEKINRMFRRHLSK